MKTSKFRRFILWMIVVFNWIVTFPVFLLTFLSLHKTYSAVIYLYGVIFSVSVVLTLYYKLLGTRRNEYLREWLIGDHLIRKKNGKKPTKRPPRFFFTALLFFCILTTVPYMVNQYFADETFKVIKAVVTEKYIQDIRGGGKTKYLYVKTEDNKKKNIASIGRLYTWLNVGDTIVITLQEGAMGVYFYRYIRKEDGRQLHPIINHEDNF